MKLFSYWVELLTPELRKMGITEKLITVYKLEKSDIQKKEELIKYFSQL